MLNYNPVAPKDNSGAKQGIQFLKPEHCINNPIAVIRDVTDVTNGGEADNFGNPYQVFFLCGGVEYSKGYKSTSDGLGALIKVFGTADEKKWIGKSVQLGVGLNRNKQQQITYSPVAGSKSKKAA